SNIEARNSAGTGDASATDVTITGLAYNGDGGTAQTISGATADNGTGDSTIVAGSIQLNSSKSFTVSADDDSLVATADVGKAISSSSVGVDEVDIRTQTGSQDALAIIDAAIAEIDSQRADLGAIQNRFGHTISNLANIQENVSASRSRIQDTDFATETAQMTKNQILQQAGTSILSQANQLPQAALSLIG
ncbi:flagellin, partial [Pseudoalteromonas sp. BZP1]|uniref:flagellin n=1 Tax=unclassified Pseudoalteromonas TaxID=194690 RepID=UPI0032C3E490